MRTRNRSNCDVFLPGSEHQKRSDQNKMQATTEERFRDLTAKATTNHRSSSSTQPQQTPPTTTTTTTTNVANNNNNNQESSSSDRPASNLKKWLVSSGLALFFLLILLLIVTSVMDNPYASFMDKEYRIISPLIDQFEHTFQSIVTSKGLDHKNPHHYFMGPLTQSAIDARNFKLTKWPDQTVNESIYATTSSDAHSILAVTRVKIQSVKRMNNIKINDELAKPFRRQSLNNIGITFEVEVRNVDSEVTVKGITIGYETKEHQPRVLIPPLSSQIVSFTLMRNQMSFAQFPRVIHLEVKAMQVYPPSVNQGKVIFTSVPLTIPSALLSDIGLTSTYAPGIYKNDFPTRITNDGFAESAKTQTWSYVYSATKWDRSLNLATPFGSNPEHNTRHVQEYLSSPQFATILSDRYGYTPSEEESKKWKAFVSGCLSVKNLLPLHMDSPTPEQCADYVNKKANLKSKIAGSCGVAKDFFHYLQRAMPYSHMKKLDPRISYKEGKDLDSNYFSVLSRCVVSLSEYMHHLKYETQAAVYFAKQSEIKNGDAHNKRLAEYRQEGIPTFFLLTGPYSDITSTAAMKNFLSDAGISGTSEERIQYLGLCSATDGEACIIERESKLLDLIYRAHSAAIDRMNDQFLSFVPQDLMQFICDRIFEQQYIYDAKATRETKSFRLAISFTIGLIGLTTVILVFLKFDPLVAHLGKRTIAKEDAAKPKQEEIKKELEPKQSELTSTAEVEPPVVKEEH